jgi:hypothetical protein
MGTLILKSRSKTQASYFFLASNLLIASHRRKKMRRYQIRVQEKFTIEDVIEEMASKGWDSIIHDLDVDKIIVPLKNYRHFQNALCHAVTPYLRHYTLCGKPDFCSDSICMCRQDNRPKPTVDSKDHIYQLYLDSNIEAFLFNVVPKAFEAIEAIIQPGRKEKVLPNLHETFRKVLANYLYYNPVCGTTPFCEYAETFSAELVHR